MTMRSIARAGPDARTVVRVSSGGRCSARGFTLIELLVVVAIIGILATIAVPAMKHAPQKAKEAALKEDLFQMRSCIDQYLADKGHYPSSLQELVDEGYLRRIPPDPFRRGNLTDCWGTVPAEDEEFEPPDEEGGGAGIMDVYFDREGETFDGIPYSEL